MFESAKRLILGSTEAHSGKSAIALGIAAQLQTQGIRLGYGKPLGLLGDGVPQMPKASVPGRSTLPTLEGAESDERPSGAVATDADTQFLAEMLSLDAEQLYPTLVTLDPQRLQYCGEDGCREDGGQVDYQSGLAAYDELRGHQVVLIEGPSTLEEGTLVGLSLPDLGELLQAPVVLVTRWQGSLSVDEVLSAQKRLGDRLLGVIFNAVLESQMSLLQDVAVPFLEARQIAVLGLLPHSELLRGVSVQELVQRLGAKVLASAERLDLMVESLCIGAMNVNSALEYFRRGHNMAVVTGSDRTDLQLAALETSTHCLILTGHMAPSASILSRAEEMEIPILSVNLDTLTTVELVEQAFGQVSFRETVKAQYMIQLSEEHLNIRRLTQLLGL